MAHKYRSSDGLLNTNDPKAVDIWEQAAMKQRVQQAAATSLLMSQDVKMEHPDDGWVNREENSITPCYPRFDLGPKDGDLIALGWPSSGYRLVRVTGKITRKGVFGPYTTYWFADTGARIEGLDKPPEPAKAKRRRPRLRRH